MEQEAASVWRSDRGQTNCSAPLKSSHLVGIPHMDGAPVAEGAIAAPLVPRRPDPRMITSILEGLKRMLRTPLLLEASKEPLDHAVLLRRIRA